MSVLNLNDSQVLSLALGGANVAIEAAKGVWGDLRDDLSERDMYLWIDARDGIAKAITSVDYRAEWISAARDACARMDTACRDYLDSVPLDGRREALAAVLNVALLVKTDEQRVAEFEEAVRGLMARGE